MAVLISIAALTAIAQFWKPGKAPQPTSIPKETAPFNLSGYHRAIIQYKPDYDWFVLGFTTLLQKDPGEKLLLTIHLEGGEQISNYSAQHRDITDQHLNYGFREYLDLVPFTRGDWDLLAEKKATKLVFATEPPTTIVPTLKAQELLLTNTRKAIYWQESN